MSDPSIQERYAPQGVCFGCGPANQNGLGLRSFRSTDDPSVLVARFQPAAHHIAFPGVVNGGILGTVLDCHCNWTAAVHVMDAQGLNSAPTTVTAEYAVTLKRPTPSDRVLHLRARFVETHGKKRVVEAELEAEGRLGARCRGTFVQVDPGHPAYGRW